MKRPGIRVVGTAAALFLSAQLLAGCTTHSPLVDAAEMGNQPMMEALMAKGVPVNEKSPAGDRAIHWAADQLNVPMMRMLIEQGAELDVRDANGNTPLIMAAKSIYSRRRGSAAEIVQMLVENGADVNKVNDFGETALSSSIENHDRESADILIANGAYPKAGALFFAGKLFWSNADKAKEEAAKKE